MNNESPDKPTQEEFNSNPEAAAASFDDKHRLVNRVVAELEEKVWAVMRDHLDLIESHLDDADVSYIISCVSMNCVGKWMGGLLAQKLASDDFARKQMSENIKELYEVSLAHYTKEFAEVAAQEKQDEKV